MEIEALQETAEFFFWQQMQLVSEQKT